MIAYTLELAEKQRTGIVMAFKPINSKPERKGKGFTLELFNDLLDRQMAGLRLEVKDKGMTARIRHQQEGRLIECQYLKQEVNGWYS